MDHFSVRHCPLQLPKFSVTIAAIEAIAIWSQWDDFSAGLGWQFLRDDEVLVLKGAIFFRRHKMLRFSEINLSQQNQQR
jgi:hypothetical protein